MAGIFFRGTNISELTKHGFIELDGASMVGLTLYESKKSPEVRRHETKNPGVTPEAFWQNVYRSLGPKK